MSNREITLTVVSLCGLFGLCAYLGLVLAPAWSSYSRIWQRVAAAFLSLYVLLALVGLGVGGGLGIVWFWDRIQG